MSEARAICRSKLGYYVRGSVPDQQGTLPRVGNTLQEVSFCYKPLGLQSIYTFKNAADFGLLFSKDYRLSIEPYLSVNTKNFKTDHPVGFAKN